MCDNVWLLLETKLKTPYLDGIIGSFFLNVIDTITKSSQGKKIYLACSLPFISGLSQGRKSSRSLDIGPESLNVGTEAEAMEECCLLACFP